MENGLLVGAFVVTAAIQLSFATHSYIGNMLRYKRNISELDDKSTYFKFVGQPFAPDTYNEEHYESLSRRCLEEKARQTKWDKENGVIYKIFFSPPYIDYMFIDSGQRFD